MSGVLEIGNNGVREGFRCSSSFLYCRFRNILSLTIVVGDLNAKLAVEGTILLSGSVVHVTFLDSPKTQTLEQFIVRRPVDEIIIFHAPGYTDQANLLVEKYHSLGLGASRALIEHIRFSSVLSEILKTLDERRFDNHIIEFSIKPKYENS